MPLFPFIGYSQAALRDEYERGVQDGRIRSQQTLYDALQQLLPGVTCQINWHSQPNMFGMAQQLVEIVSAELTRRQEIPTYSEAENRRLQAKVSELEGRLAEFRPVKLVEQINNLTAERNVLLQQITTLHVESNRAKSEYSVKLEELQKEIARLDELVVKYEHRSRPQNAKH